MRLTLAEVEAKKALLARMQQHELEHYVDEEEGLEVRVEHSETTVKVKRLKKDKEE